MIVENIIDGGFINFIGGAIRWYNATIWRMLFKHTKRYTFKEYLYGPKNAKDWFDKHGHELNNKIIGILAIATLCFLITKLLS